MERKPLEIKTFSILGDGIFGIYGPNEEMWGKSSFQKMYIYRLLETMLSSKVGSKPHFVYLLTSYLLKSNSLKNFL